MQHTIYDHVIAVMGREAVLERFDLTQLVHDARPYLASLPTRHDDAVYLQRRIQAGLRHYRLGLSPGLYAAVCSAFLTDAMRALWEEIGSNHLLFLSACGALAKLVSIDVSVMADVYALGDKTLRLRRPGAYAAGRIDQRLFQ